MPNGYGFLDKVHAVQTVDLRKQSGQHFACRKIFFHFGFGEGVFGFAQFFAGVSQIPSLRLFNTQRFAGEGLHFGQIFFGKRLGAFGQIAQKIEHLCG